MAEKTLYLFLTFSVNFVMWRALDKLTISELKVLLIYIFHHSMCMALISMVNGLDTILVICALFAILKEMSLTLKLNIAAVINLFSFSLFLLID